MAIVRRSPIGSLACVATGSASPETPSPQLAVLLTVLTTDPLGPDHGPRSDRALEDHLADSLVALELDEVRGGRVDRRPRRRRRPPGLAAGDRAARARRSSWSRATGASASSSLARSSACGVANAEVVHRRAEAWPEGIERFDLVTARALAPLPVVAEYAAPLLAGRRQRCVAWRGRRDAADEAARPRRGRASWGSSWVRSSASSRTRGRSTAICS